MRDQLESVVYSSLTLRLLAILPITIVVTYLRFFGARTDTMFLTTVTTTAILAILAVTVLAMRKFPVNRVVLGANIWIVLAALSLVNGWVLVQQYMFHFFSEAGFFLVIFIVGLFSMYFFKTGFIGIPNRDPNVVRKYSLYLLFATALAMLWADYFRGDVNFGGSLPFLVLALVQWLLMQRASKLNERK